MDLFKTLLAEASFLAAEQELYELAANKIAYIAQKQKDPILTALFGDPCDMAKKIVGGVKKASDMDLKEAEQVVETFAKVSEKHLQWIVNKYVKVDNNGKPPFLLEDGGRIHDAILKFEEDRKRLKKKDLLQYKTLDELETAVDNEDEFEAEPPGAEHNVTPVEQSFIDKKEVEIIHRGDGVRVYVPKTEPASCYFGRGTKWCTAAKNGNRFEGYNKQGKLYIVYAGGKKYQLHFESGQFMNSKDHPADIAQLFSDYPVLYKIFEKQAAKSGRLAMMSDGISQELLDKGVAKALKSEGIIGVLKELSAKKLERIKTDLEKYLHSQHIPATSTALRNRKSEHASAVAQLFTRNDVHLKIPQEKLTKVYSPQELLDLYSAIHGSSNLSILNSEASLIMKHILSDRVVRDKMGDEAISEYIDDKRGYRVNEFIIAAIHNLVAAGYKLKDEDFVKIALLLCGRYDPDKNLRAFFDAAKHEPDEELQLKLVEKNHEALKAFSNSSNKVKERARMYAKRDSEKSWR